MGGATPEATARPPGFGTGVRCFFSGMWWTMITPSVWPLAAVPIALAVLLTGVLGALSIGFVPDWIGSMIGATSTLGSIGAAIAGFAATVLALVLSALVAFALAQPLSGPALEGIVRKSEAVLGAPARPESTIATEIGRSLQSLVVGYMFGLPALIILFALSIVVPYASIILFPMKLVVAACTLAWDICDYPLSVRGLPMAQRIGIMFRHKGAILGFSLGLALVGLLPCMLFLLLPGGVSGAARLMWRVEQHERSQGRDMDGISRA